MTLERASTLLRTGPAATIAVVAVALQSVAHLRNGPAFDRPTHLINDLRRKEISPWKAPDRYAHLAAQC